MPRGGRRLGISPRELERFRQTLPEYRRWERYSFLFLRWDIVKAHYILSQYPREATSLDVAQAAQVMGFHIPEGKLVVVDGKERPYSSLYTVDVANVMSEQIDLTRPVLLAQVALSDSLEPKAMLVDGLHRLYKAARLGQEEIPAYVLTPEEEQVCRY